MTHSMRTLGMSYGRSRSAAIAAPSIEPAGAIPFWTRMPGPTTRVNQAAGFPWASRAARKTLYVDGR